SYLSGREKFQGETLDWVWFDEEPPADIYTEGLTRTNIGNNPVWMTFTPLLGMSEVVRRFLQEKSEDRHVTSMTIDDVEHYTAEEKQRIIASYPKHELEARTKGIPVLGSGRIFPVDEVKIAVETATFRITGRASVEWISAGTIRLRPSNSSGTATPTPYTSPDAID